MMMTPRIALIASAAAVLTTGAQAAFTNVEPPSAEKPWEKSHAEIFQEIFGGAAFTQNGNDYSNGTVEVTRVDDDNDKTFSFDTWSARALSVNASASQAFGTVSDGSLFNVTGGNTHESSSPVSGSISDVPGGDNIRFKRFGKDDFYMTVDVSTDPAENLHQADHVVTYTYSIDGQEVPDTYLLFFEDQCFDWPFTDYDYNDLVVEVTAGSNIPEPGSLALLAIGGATMLRRRR